MKNEVLHRIKKLMKLTSYGIICQILLINMLVAGDLFGQQRSQNIQVSGKVLDENGESLPGASVIVKGTTSGTVTDFDGNYKIEVPEDGILIFSYVGYAREEINVNGRTVLNVDLVPDLAQLAEIIVIGYGETQKKDVTGALATLDARQIERRVSVNPLDNIQGQMPGVAVTNSSGRPGGGMQVRIRGSGSINGGNEPLYVIDGILNADIELINTNDIENITVLKDASATAIYGFQAANGVVIVTTKKGKKGGVTVDLNYNLQVGQLTNAPEMLNSEEYWTRIKPAIDEDLRTRTNGPVPASAFIDNYAAMHPFLFNPGDDPVYGDPVHDTDWLEESTRKSVSHQYFANVRGGGDNYTASFSIGRQEDEGIMLNTFLDKTTMRFNGDYDIKDWLKVGGGISFAETTTNILDDYRIGADALANAALFYLPIYPTRYEDGSIVNADDLRRLDGQLDVWYGRTPVDRLNMFTRETNTLQVLRNFFIEVDILKNLKFRTAYSQQDIRRDNRTHEPKELDTFVNRSAATVSNTELIDLQWENTLNYSLAFGNNQSLNVLGGASLYKTESFSSVAASFELDDFFGVYNLGDGNPEQNRASSSFTESKAVSFFGRANYSYDDRYLLTVTGRYDGSSRFGLDNEFAFFPSAAAAWNISNESFLADNGVVSNLKLRTSWGKTGNSGIGAFDRFGRLDDVGVVSVFGESAINGTIPLAIGNNGLKWEVTTETNIGLDIGLFNHVDLSLDYYNKESDDLLFNVPIAVFSGYNSLLGNAGSIRNRGIELMLSAQVINTRDFNWNVYANYTRNTNEILSLGTDDADLFRSMQWADLLPDQVFRVGETFGSFHGYSRLGTWNIGEEDEAAVYGAEPGDIRFEDVDNDGDIDSKDAKIIGNPLPDFTLNFGSSFTYKNFTLSFDIRGSFGNEIVDYSVLLNVDRMGYGNVYKEFIDRAWTPDNQNTMYPRIRKDVKFFRGIDSGHVFDGSFLRGQNLSLTYDFDPGLVGKIGMGSASVYVNLQNWFLITDYHGYDPEASSIGEFPGTVGYELSAYPKSFITNIGIRASF